MVGSAEARVRSANNSSRALTSPAGSAGNESALVTIANTEPTAAVRSRSRE